MRRLRDFRFSCSPGGRFEIPVNTFFTGSCWAGMPPNGFKLVRKPVAGSVGSFFALAGAFAFALAALESAFVTNVVALDV
jgi:hypothetical protein